MNGKRAKALRKEANKKALSYIKKEVLSPEMSKDYDDKELLSRVLPERTLFPSGVSRNKIVGVNTKRWFYLQEKKNVKN